MHIFNYVLPPHPPPPHPVNGGGGGGASVMIVVGLFVGQGFLFLCLGRETDVCSVFAGSAFVERRKGERT